MITVFLGSVGLVALIAGVLFALLAFIAGRIGCNMLSIIVFRNWAARCITITVPFFIGWAILLAAGVQ